MATRTTPGVTTSIGCVLTHDNNVVKVCQPYVQVMEKAKTLPLNARAKNASRGLGYHLAHTPRYLLTGCWGECIAQQGQSLYHYGTLLVIIEYGIFVVLSLNGRVGTLHQQYD